MKITFLVVPYFRPVIDSLYVVYIWFLRILRRKREENWDMGSSLFWLQSSYLFIYILLPTYPHRHTSTPVHTHTQLFCIHHQPCGKMLRGGFGMKKKKTEWFQYRNAVSLLLEQCLQAHQPLNIPYCRKEHDCSHYSTASHFFFFLTNICIGFKILFI